MDKIENLEEILAAVAFGFAVSPDKIKAPGKTVEIILARLAFYRLATEYSGRSNREIAEHVKRSDPGTARYGAKASKDQFETDPTFKANYKLAETFLIGSSPVPSAKSVAKQQAARQPV